MRKEEILNCFLNKEEATKVLTKKNIKNIFYHFQCIIGNEDFRLFLLKKDIIEHLKSMNKANKEYFLKYENEEYIFLGRKELEIIKCFEPKNLKIIGKIIEDVYFRETLYLKKEDILIVLLEN